MSFGVNLPSCELGPWSIAGGKYTTYRSMAEKLVDQVVADLVESVAATPSRTATDRLVGVRRGLASGTPAARKLQGAQVAAYPDASNHIDHLLNRYGATARSLVTEHSADSESVAASCAWRPDHRQLPERLHSSSAARSVNRVARVALCTTCGRQLSWYDNIPVLSYAVLGGRCRTCRAPISIMYPMVEIATAVAVRGGLLEVWADASLLVPGWCSRAR